MCKRATLPKKGRRRTSPAVPHTAEEARQRELHKLEGRIIGAVYLALDAVTEFPYRPAASEPFRREALQEGCERHPLTLGAQLRELADLCDRWECPEPDSFHGYDYEDENVVGKYTLFPAASLFPHIARQTATTSGN